MLKRYCDTCEQLIPDSERFYEVALAAVKAGRHHSIPPAEVCVQCARKGAALVSLFQSYERELAKKA